MIPTPTSPGALLVREINQMEREICSYLEWQLDIEPGAFIEFECMLRWNFEGPGPHPAHSLGPFAHPKLGHFHVYLTNFPVFLCVDGEQKTNRLQLCDWGVNLVVAEE